MTEKHIRVQIKRAATALNYLATKGKGMPIKRINTPSLQSGGVNVLALSGYSDTQLQNLGRWRDAIFKEYIQDELTCYSKGMLTSMCQKFGFVNIEGGVYHNVTTASVLTDYDVDTEAAV